MKMASPVTKIIQLITVIITVLEMKIRKKVGWIANNPASFIPAVSFGRFESLWKAILEIPIPVSGGKESNNLQKGPDN